MVFPWPGYILYPLYAHNPILKYTHIENISKI